MVAPKQSGPTRTDTPSRLEPLSPTPFSQQLLDHLDALYNMAVWLTGRDEDQGLDLVQQTLTKALAARHTFKDGTNMKAWLFTILRKAFIDELRRQQKEHLFGSDEEGDRLAVAVEGVGGVGPLMTVLLRRDIDRALAQLPPLYRMTVVAVDLEGLRLEEVAAIFDVPLGTVKSRLSRARALMASYLSEYATK